MQRKVFELNRCALERNRPEAIDRCSMGSEDKKEERKIDLSIPIRARWKKRLRF